MNQANNGVEPKVFFDPTSGFLKLEGRSQMRETEEFFQPILEKIQNTTVPTFIVEMKLEYFDSATAKYLMLIFDELKNKQKMGAQLLIHWYSEEEDDDHIEIGQDISAETGLKFQFKTLG